jgi:hypothetical protein
LDGRRIVRDSIANEGGGKRRHDVSFPRLVNVATFFGYPMILLVEQQDNSQTVIQ